MISTLRRLGGSGSETSPELLRLEDDQREDPGTQIIGQEVAVIETVDPEPETVEVGRESGKGKGSAGAAWSVRKSSGEGSEKGVGRDGARSSVPEASMITPVKTRRMGEEHLPLGGEVEEGAASANSGYQSAEMRMPMGLPMAYGPVAVGEWIYQKPHGEFIPPRSRPDFLEKDERRIERDQEIEEMRKEIRSLYEENARMKKKMEERSEVASRILAEKDAAKFRTPEEASESDLRMKKGKEDEVEVEDEKRGDKGGRREEVRSEKKEEVTQIQIMVKLMEGMQALQHRILDGKDDDKSQDAEVVLTHVHPLPELCEWDPSTGPIDLGDWLSLIEPIMSDMSKTSVDWWSRLMQEASQWYEDHQQLPPLNRLSHGPTPSPALCDPKWSRLEKRAATMLLRAPTSTSKR